MPPASTVSEREDLDIAIAMSCFSLYVNLVAVFTIGERFQFIETKFKYINLTSQKRLSGIDGIINQIIKVLKLEPFYFETKIAQLRAQYFSMIVCNTEQN